MDSRFLIDCINYLNSKANEFHQEVLLKEKENLNNSVKSDKHFRSKLMDEGYIRALDDFYIKLHNQLIYLQYEFDKTKSYTKDKLHEIHLNYIIDLILFIKNINITHEDVKNKQSEIVKQLCKNLVDFVDGLNKTISDMSDDLEEKSKKLEGLHIESISLKETIKKLSSELHAKDEQIIKLQATNSEMELIIKNNQQLINNLELKAKTQETRSEMQKQLNVELNDLHKTEAELYKLKYSKVNEQNAAIETTNKLLSDLVLKSNTSGLIVSQKTFNDISLLEKEIKNIKTDSLEQNEQKLIEYNEMEVHTSLKL